MSDAVSCSLVLRGERGEVALDELAHELVHALDVRVHGEGDRGAGLERVVLHREVQRRRCWGPPAISNAGEEERSGAVAASKPARAARWYGSHVSFAALGLPKAPSSFTAFFSSTSPRRPPSPRGSCPCGP